MSKNSNSEKAGSSSINKDGEEKSTRMESDLPTIIPCVDRVADFIKFANWYGTPSDLRTEKNQREFAMAIRVDEDTLTAWKHNPYFYPLVRRFIGEWIQERVPDVVNSLFQNAYNGGKAGDVKTLLGLLNIFLNENNSKK